MTDRERARLRGPVRSVRSDLADLDPRTNDWGPFRQGQTLVYDVEGRLEGFVWDEGVTTRDGRGLRTTVNRSGPLIFRPPGLEWGMSFDPTNLADVLTRYDAADRPFEIVYRTAEQKMLHRIELLYDGNGRIFRERVVVGDDFGSQSSPSSQDIAAGKTELSAREQQGLNRIYQMLMPDGVLMTREYEYDRVGRVSEVRTTNLGLAESLQTFIYDDHDNVVEEHEQEASREANLDRAGRRITRNETSSERWARHEYRYDAQGNWVEKVTLQRQSSDRDFRRSNVTRRVIAYW